MSDPRRRRIALLHPAFLGGGAEAVGLWTAQALCSDYDVTIFSFSELDLGGLNGYYGTSLDESRLKIVNPLPGRVGRWVGRSIRLLTARQYLLSRLFKEHATGFDLAISTFNELDMGAPGVQYIHYPIFSKRARQVRRIVGYPENRLRKLLSSAGRLAAGFDDAAAEKNISVVNSQWTAGVVRQVYGGAPIVVYPPVNTASPMVDWADRRNAFICISRIVEEKQVDTAVCIIDRVRRAGFDVSLRIVGGTRKDSDRRVERALSKLQRARRNWLDVQFNLSRDELSAMISRYRFGLHVRENEQFGIAVAEMAAAGCIPFVPASGGAPEIIDREAALIFSDTDEAVERICHVLRNRPLHEQLSRRVVSSAKAFGIERFMTEIRIVVQAAFDRQNANGCA